MGIMAGGAAASSGVSGVVSASQSSYDVAATLTVRNHTKWRLRYEKCYPIYGKVKSPMPGFILPGYEESMEMHKTSGQTSGTCGTVGFVVEKLEKPVVVMWSVPYNHNHHYNWLGVGQYIGHNEYSFSDMYYRDIPINFTRRDFYSDISPITYNSECLRLSGSMGSAHKTDIFVDVMPRDLANFADRRD